MTTASGRQVIRRLEGGIRTPIIDYVRSQLPGYVGDRYRLTGIARPSLSVGTGRVPVQPPRPSVSDVVPETPRGPIYPDLPAIDRRDQPPKQEVVPMWKKQSNGRWTLNHPKVGKVTGLTDIGAARLAAELGIAAPSTAVAVKPANLQTQPGGPEMDLGTLATDLLRQAGTAYIQRELGPRQTTPVTYTPTFDIPFTDMGVEADIPFIDVVQRQKCKRKRRRPIATPSEISQLASLKQVASPGEVKLFLAKRLRT